MADELTLSKRHIEKAMWEFVDATYDLDLDRARNASDDVLMLLQHVNQLKQRRIQMADVRQDAAKKHRELDE